MKSVFVAAEYNPFHLGHRCQIEKLKTMGFECVIAAMSGEFVQRGGPAIYPKYQRAKVAVENGCSLVLQLPYAYCAQNAETFAQGAVMLAEKTGAGYMAFGAENADIGLFYEAAELIESGRLNSELEKSVGAALPFAALRIAALEKTSGRDFSFLNKPNNILALEYVRAIIRNKLKLEAIALPRNESFSSAAKIREAIFAGEKEAVRKMLLEDAFDMTNSLQPLNADAYAQLIKAKLLMSTPEELAEISDMPEGFANRLKKNADMLNEGVESFIARVNGKTIASSRVRRLLFNMLLGYSSKMREKYMASFPNYVRLFGADKKGREALKNVAQKNDSVIITKLSDDIKKLDELSEESVRLDMKACELYNLINGASGEDMRYTPFIKEGC